MTPSDRSANEAPSAGVLYVSSSGDLFGGAERCLVDISTRIGAYGWSPVVAVPRSGDLATSLAAAGIPVHILELGVLRSRRELRSPALAIRLAQTVPASLALGQLIRAGGVRVIHSNTSVVLAGALAARLTGRPHVWHVREVLSGPVWHLIRAVILALSARVVCISSAVAENVAARASPGSRVVVIPDGIDLDHFRLPDRRPSAGPLRVGMVARINPMKGHEQFLRAAGLVAQQVPNVSFYVAGGHIPAYEYLRQRLLALTSTLGLDHQVHFVGHLDRAAVRDLVGSLDVLVLPSTLPEGGGLVALEAMALGRPVVATRHGGPLDAIADGVNGLLVPPADVANLASAIVTLLRDSSLRQRLGAEARRVVESRYSLHQHVEDVAALYAEVQR